MLVNCGKCVVLNQFKLSVQQLCSFANPCLLWNKLYYNLDARARCLCRRSTPLFELGKKKAVKPYQACFFAKRKKTKQQIIFKQFQATKVAPISIEKYTSVSPASRNNRKRSNQKAGRWTHPVLV